MTIDFVLGNAEDYHRDAPRTFFIPSRAARESLAQGELVRLVFELSQDGPDLPHAERMWVIVRSREGSQYLGELDNDPAFITTVAAGDEVRFGPEHVIDIWDDDADPRLDLKVMVSRRSHEEDLRPGYLVHEEPLNEMDSGWQALVGEETDDELDDANSVLLQAVGYLTNRWPELAPVILGDQQHRQWVWDEDSGRYQPLPSQGEA